VLRSSYHESLQIIRWSAETILSLDLYKCPMIEQGLDQVYDGRLISLYVNGGRFTSLYM
jgi:hypothetical protein